ncbi:MAG: T9SS type A sorting domain-containing protein [Chryseobacterium sp.]|jgi:hypothetical protein|uniref:T9SS type A sorting domain-containing protein n=1 Tax=Chryseobacterium sp. TaxID=1871047 RepID=UPI00281792CA|nr:T9SS type A sorting domain-containing protein [Chryseobacterium sp.]MDR2238240.1 T9SS type A sorting domain-containing protein [Chryseobacterium sp.]
MKNIFTVLYTLSSLALYSQGWVQSSKVLASERNVAGQFGFNVFLKNNTLYSNAIGNNTDADEQNFLFQAGSLYVFERENNTWIQKAKIVPNDRASSDGFGKEFALDHDDLFISAPYKLGERRGAVYLFNKNSTGNWVQTQKILSPVIVDNDAFGMSIGADSKILAVGATFSDISVFEFNSNTQQFALTQTLTFPNGENTHNPSVFVYGNKIFAGKRTTTVNGTPQAGQVNIYSKNTAGAWEITQTINSPVAGANEFGYNIFAKDEYLLITAYMGMFVSVYKYNPASGDYEYKQTINGDNSSFFGTSVSLENNTLIIGAPASMNGTKNSGSVFIYGPKGNDEWILTQKIYQSDPASFDGFGYGVSISNGRIATGAPHQAYDETGNNYVSTAGAVYVFKDPTLAVHEAGSKEDPYQIFPNPFSNSISVKLEKAYDQLTAEVFDLSGRKIYAENFSGKQSIELELGFLNSGTYLVKVYSKDKTLITTKVIKK